jgi:hypothetical protein
VSRGASQRYGFIIHQLLNTSPKRIVGEGMSTRSLDVLEDEFRPLLARGVSSESVMGTVMLTDGDVVYIPPATSDPRG